MNRRKFLKTLGIGAVAAVAAPGAVIAAVKAVEKPRQFTVTLLRQKTIWESEMEIEWFNVADSGELIPFNFCKPEKEQ